VLSAKRPDEGEEVGVLGADFTLFHPPREEDLLGTARLIRARFGLVNKTEA
jgi:hypothetical protein